MNRAISDNKGSALAMTLFVFSLIMIMAATLTIVVGGAMNVDTSTLKREQALLYAKAGLNIAYDYIGKKKDDATFLQTKFAGNTFTGKISDITGDSDGEGGTFSVPNNMEGHTFTIECSYTGTVFKVVSTAEYMGTKAQAVGYFYQKGTSSTLNDDAISSPSEDMEILTTIYNRTGKVQGSLRGRNIKIAGGATYASVYALGGFTSNASNAHIVENLMAHDYINVTGNGNGVGGDISCVGYINLPTFSTYYPKSIVAFGRKSAADVGTNNGKNLYNGQYAINYSMNGDMVGSDDSDTKKIVFYSGDDAKITANTGTFHGSVVVNGNLTTQSSNTSLIIDGDLIVKGSINNLQYAPTVSGTVYSNLSDAEFNNAINGRDYITAKSIETELQWPVSFPVTVFPDICNAGPQRTEDYWGSHTETVAEYNLRRTKLKEYDLSVTSDVRYLTKSNAYGPTTLAPGGAPNSSYYDDGIVFIKEGWGTNTAVIKLSKSGRYTNLDVLAQKKLNQISAGLQESTGIGGIVLVIDASTQDLDIAIGGNWSFKLNASWFYIQPRIIINDGGGTHQVRLFLEKGTTFDMSNAQALEVTTDNGSQVVKQLLNGGSYNSDVSMIPGEWDSKDTKFSKATAMTIPRFFIFGDGEYKQSGESGWERDLSNSANKINIQFNPNTIMGFRGYIFVPYSELNLYTQKSPIFMGKAEAGKIKIDGASEFAMIYENPSDAIYSEAINGVFFPVTGGGGSSTGGASTEPYYTSPEKFDEGF